MHSKHTPFTSCDDQLLINLRYTLKKITTKHVKRCSSIKVVYFFCSPQMSASKFGIITEFVMVKRQEELVIYMHVRRTCANCTYR